MKYKIGRSVFYMGYTWTIIFYKLIENETSHVLLECEDKDAGWVSTGYYGVEYGAPTRAGYTYWWVTEDDPKVKLALTPKGNKYI